MDGLYAFINSQELRALIPWMVQCRIKDPSLLTLATGLIPCPSNLPAPWGSPAALDMEGGRNCASQPMLWLGRTITQSIRGLRTLGSGFSGKLKQLRFQDFRGPLNAALAARTGLFVPDDLERIDPYEPDGTRSGNKALRWNFQPSEVRTYSST